MHDEEVRKRALLELQQQQVNRDRGEISDNKLEELDRGIPLLYGIARSTWAAWKAHNTRGTYEFEQLENMKNMRALLFSNFPPSINEDILRPKLEQHGVHVVRVINYDKSPNVSVEEIDLIIAMVEVMSVGQREKLKELARQNGKKFIALSRKVAAWNRQLGNSVTPQLEGQRMVANGSSHAPQSQRFGSMASVFPPQLRSVPPANQEAEITPPSDEEVELLKLFEEENAKLEAQKDELIERLKKSEEENRAFRSGNEKLRMERDQGIQQIRKANAEAEKVQVEVKRVINLCELLESKLADVPDDDANSRREVEAYKKGHAELSKELEAAKELAKKQTQELYTLREENKALRTLPPPSSTRATTVKATEDFTKVRDAFKILWRTGAMKGDDILKTLMDWEPKE